ncbi:MAG TPA: hypothetical protein VGM91_12525 [Conexibacter sp.]|jgi:hypothetical protein
MRLRRAIERAGLDGWLAPRRGAAARAGVDARMAPEPGAAARAGASARAGGGARPTLEPAGAAARANVVRNARAERSRLDRWQETRDRCWSFLDPLIADGARVAVLGAGKAHTLPVSRIAARAGSVALLDIDPVSARMGRRRVGARERRRVSVIEHDVTLGRADAIIAATLTGAARFTPPPPAATPLPGAPYDVVIGDLLYTQLVYPALHDAGVAGDRMRAALALHGQPLVNLVVARMHASAPLVVHLHDPIAWLPGSRHPIAIEQVLEARSAVQARGLIARGRPVASGDVRHAVETTAGITLLREAWWRWPFAPGSDYLVWALAAARVRPPNSLVTLTTSR